VLDYNFRKDYKQVLYLHDKTTGYFHDQVIEMFLEAGQGEYDDFNDVAHANLEKIEGKMAEMAEIGLSITKKTLFLMEKFCDRLLRGIE
jgi:hypothetical protein